MMWLGVVVGCGDFDFVGVEHQLSRKHAGKLAGRNISSLARERAKRRSINTHQHDAPINHGIQIDSPATKPTLCIRGMSLSNSTKKGYKERIDAPLLVGLLANTDACAADGIHY